LKGEKPVPRHKTYDLLERIHVKTPCDADWDSMSGDERVRFCAHCERHVNDLSRLTRAEALKLVTRSGGRLCVRYVSLPGGQLVTADAPPAPLYRITRRASRIAAGAFTAAIGLSAGVAAQAQSNAGGAPAVQSQPAPQAGGDGQQTVNAQQVVNLPLKAWQETATMGVVVLVEPREPLVKAAFKDDLAEVEKILSGGTDANVLDRGIDSTALMQAVEHANMKMVKRLLDAGADVNAENRAGRTALMMLMEDATPELVRALVEAGALVNMRDDAGNAALAQAAAVCGADVVRQLIDLGAKLNTRNDEGRTALMLAAENGSLDAVKALVAAGADFNLKDDEGRTALNFAKENDHTEVANYLVAHGAVEGSVKTDEDAGGEEAEGDEQP
jgi:hypothetical protein